MYVDVCFVFLSKFTIFCIYSKCKSLIFFKLELWFVKAFDLKFKWNVIILIVKLYLESKI